MITKEQGKEEIKKLVKRKRRNKEVSEEEKILRIDFYRGVWQIFKKK